MPKKKKNKKKKQENMTHNQEWNQSIEPDPEAIEMIKLSNKDTNGYYKYVLYDQETRGKYNHV